MYMSQLTYRYLASNQVSLIADLANNITEYRPVYQRTIQLYRGIDNTISFEIKNSDQKSIKEISNEIFELAGLAKDRKLKVADLKGATFTISSLSGIGGKFFTPIINPPEVGILGLSKTFNHVSLKDGEVKESKQMPVSLSYDHRVINGAYAAKFITEFSAQLNRIQYLEDTFNNA